MPVNSHVQPWRLFHLRSNGPVRLDPMNSHAAGIVIGGEHMRAGDVRGHMNRARRQRCGLAVRKQGPGGWIDSKRAQPVLAAARRRAVRREIAGPAVAPGNIKVLLRRMLRCFLHICRKCQRTPLDESRAIDIHVILREFSAHGGVQHHLARSRCFCRLTCSQDLFEFVQFQSPAKLRAATLSRERLQPPDRGRNVHHQSSCNSKCFRAASSVSGLSAQLEVFGFVDHPHPAAALDRMRQCEMVWSIMM